MLFIRTYVSPTKASEEVALMKAEVVNIKPKTLMRIQTLLALSRYSITALINDIEGEKKKGKKPHGSHSHNVHHVDAGWLSSLKYS